MTHPRTRRWPSLFPALATVATLALAPAAQATQPVSGLAGAYLAARHASGYNDYRAAAQYYPRALLNDPSNPVLLESAILAFVGLGQIDRAVPVARRLGSLGRDSQIGGMVLVADQLQRGQFDEVLADLDAGRSIGPLVDALTRAWALFGAGRMSDALAAFDAAEADTGLAAFGSYHKALALAAVGDFATAETVMASDKAAPLRLTRRGILAHAQILSQLERGADALAMLDEVDPARADAELNHLRNRLDGDAALPFDVVKTAADGASELFYTVAGALNGEAADGYTLLYAQLALFLKPDHASAMLLAAGLLERQNQYDLASAVYQQVPPDSPSFFVAELGRAESLEDAGKSEAAIEVLTQLSKTNASLPVVHVTLGDAYRRQKDYRRAASSYEKAIALYPSDERDQWFVYYARGITYERSERWDQAEADFRKALELSPNQPEVLNYLGYSFVEKGQNYDEALDLIERAVARRPDDGYITDSLGWVLYRLGRYDEAVPYMERAVELEPVDPIVNDHLGDVLWSVGRRLEAEFQWKRALSFIDPDDIPAELDPDRIRRKLEVGLDAVLSEEGAAPLKVANGD